MNPKTNMVDTYPNYRNEMIDSKEEKLAENELGFVFFILLFAYFLKFSNITEFDAVLIAWGLITIYTISRIKINIIFVSLCTYVFLAIFYIFGILTSTEAVDSDYEKTLLSFSFLTAIVLGLTTGETKEIKFPNRLLRGKYFLYILYLLILFWIVYIFNTSKTLGDYIVQDYGGANYLTTSDLLAMFTLSIVAGKRINTFESLAFAAITVIGLALLGSRASIAIFLFAYIFSLKKIISLRTAVVVLIIFLGIYFGFQFIENSGTRLFYRLETIFHISEDESRIGRQELFKNYISNITDNPICILFPCPPTPGSYVHNFLSLHQYFGLIPFLIFLLITTLSLIEFLKYSYNHFACLYIYSLMQVLLFRSWVSLAFPVFLGVAISIYKYKNKKSD